MALAHVESGVALPQSGSVLGLDVGFSETQKSSAVCRLSWNATSVWWDIRRFRFLESEARDAIAHVAGDDRILAAAFDGPMMRGLSEIGRYRTAERVLTHRLGMRIGKPGQSSAPVGRSLNRAANTYAKMVQSVCDLARAAHAHAIDDASIAEAFPSSFLGLLLPDPIAVPVRRGNRSDVYFVYVAANGILDRLLTHLLPCRHRKVEWEAVTNHDDRAALICALTALSVAAQDYTAVGCGLGWIILPPRSLLPSWAMDDLNASAANIASSSGVA